MRAVKIGTQEGPSRALRQGRGKVERGLLAYVNYSQVRKGAAYMARNVLIAIGVLVKQ